MEGGRKWEELNTDCLVNVFGRVGMESLLLDVPFVCKSWYKATQIPQCWERIVFPELDPEPWCYSTFVSRLRDEYQVDSCASSTAIIKFVVKRGARSTTLLSLPYCTTEETLTCVADECPALKTLLLLDGQPCHLFSKIPSLVSKWKHLEILGLRNSYDLKEILAQISIHCKNFFGLILPGANMDDDDQASAIVTSLPNIEYLILRGALLERENLLTILKGCKELVVLDVRDCNGFEGDDEILKLASDIQEFMYEGSKLRVPWSDVPEDILVSLDFQDDNWLD